MNKTRLAAVAKYIRESGKRKHRPHFDMERFCHDGCGTSGCIAGMAVALYDKKLWEDELAYVASTTYSFRYAQISIMASAQKILGLSSRQAEELFYPSRVMYERVTPDIAAGVIEKFIKTGRVIWPEEVKEAA